MQIYSPYYHRDLRSLIDRFHCEHCQRNKLSGKGYGLLPEREIRQGMRCGFDRTMDHPGS